MSGHLDAVARVRRAQPDLHDRYSVASFDPTDTTEPGTATQSRNQQTARIIRDEHRSAPQGEHRPLVSLAKAEVT
jgi:hypothetical protein